MLVRQSKSRRMCGVEPRRGGGRRGFLHSFSDAWVTDPAVPYVYMQVTVPGSATLQTLRLKFEEAAGGACFSRTMKVSQTNTQFRAKIIC